MEEGESILDAGLRHNVALNYGCRNGACGACKSKIVQGEVHYGTRQPMALSEQDRVEGKALFCLALPESDLIVEAEEVASAQTLPVKNFPCKVARMERLAPDVMRLFLKLPDADRLQFLAGQYIDLLPKEGGRRAFSLANTPEEDQYLELHVRWVPGGRFTSYVFESMQEGEMLRLEGPHGNFYLRDDSDRPMILVGGGTGFAPLKGVLEHAFHMGMRRPMHLFWGARAEGDLYLDGLVREWLVAQPQLQYTPVLSEVDDAAGWTGARGWVTDAVVAAYPELSEYDIYLCGPPPMVEMGRRLFPQHGADEQRIFFDSFDFASD